MPVFDVRFYAVNPTSIFSTGIGNTSIYSGPATPTGTAAITDNETGARGQTLDDDDSAGTEAATADVTVGGATSIGSNVDAEISWTIRDTVTGETFQIVQFNVEDSAAAGNYLLSEQPLVPGRAYETVEYDTLPDVALNEPVFTYADFVDGIVTGTAGNDTIDTSYTGDPQGEQIDNYDNIVGRVQTEESLNWSDFIAGGPALGPSLSTSTGGIDINVTFTNDGGATATNASTVTQYTDGDDPFNPNSALLLQGAGGPSDTSTTIFDFTAAAGGGKEDYVRDVHFRINDIDAAGWQDIVTVTAIGADGNPVQVDITIDGNETLSGNTITAGNTADDAIDQAGSAFISIPGPVSSISIDYNNGGASGQVLYISDMHFLAVDDFGDQDDSVEAGAGDDFIAAAQGNDTVDGGTGQDTVVAGVGNDSLLGGDDQDTFQLDDGFGTDTVAGGEGGTDYDTLDATGLTSGVDVTFSGAEAGTLSDGTSTATFTEIEALSLTDQDDTVDASAATAPVDVFSDAGDDSLTGGTQNDTLVAGSGDDTVEGGAGADVIVGQAGSDSLSGGLGNDTISGDNDPATTVGSGTPVFTYEYYELDGKSLTDLASAGFDANGNNSQTPTATGITDTTNPPAIDTANGGNGDTFGVKLTTTLTVTAGGTYDFSLSSDDGAALFIDGVRVINHDGLHATTTMTGSTALTPGEHVIELIYFENGGNSTMDLTVSGADTGGSPVSIESVATLTGPFDDVLDGGGGDDIVDGGFGSDTISGGTGADTLTGGDDADLFLMEDGFGSDTITGGEGGTDTDTIDGSALTSGVTVTLSGDEAGTFADGTDTAGFSEIESFVLTGQDDTFDGSAATTAAATVDGGAGDDVLTGGAANDVLSGGADNDTLTGGGGGDDTLTGGTNDDTFVYTAGGGNDVIADFGSGNSGPTNDGNQGNNDFVDLSGFYDNLSELQADQADDGVLNQSNVTDTKGRTVDYGDNSGFGAGSLTLSGVGAGSLTFDNTNVICFAEGTMIATPDGPVAIEELVAGDQVTTLDHGAQTVRWIGSRAVAGKGKLAPVTIDTGVLDNDAPLSVSPQHRMLVRGAIAQAMFGVAELLVAAKHLVGWDGITQGDRATVRYFHVLFDRHEIVFAQGALAESFHPGEVGMSSIDHAARDEIFALFPELRDGFHVYGAAARPTLTGAQAEALRARGGLDVYGGVI